MEQKILIGNTVIDDPFVVEYSYSGQDFHIQHLSEALTEYRRSIAIAVAENSEFVNDYLPIGIVGSVEEANAFIEDYQKANHLPHKNPLSVE